MAISSVSMNWVSTTLSKNSNVPPSHELPRTPANVANKSISCSIGPVLHEESNCSRRLLVLGVGALTIPAIPLLAEEVPKSYRAFVDRGDGYSYYYPSDWREFDFRGHDSAFKDRFLQLQNVRVRFIPTDKKDIHDMGSMEQVLTFLVKHRYAAPNQVATIMDMQERNVDGKNYYTVEFELTSPNFSSASFTTVAVANGRFYTLVVAANERRWRRVRDKLKVVADSFKVFDI
ncbi:hypothetical protein K2173_020377 [Erythroxylum novogranatense]|uniref:PsbP C-terminal domain-containing protein n=1 Tax=Erythroxylum novogranatense TaxID=1862640 RepID=A0AAV8TGC5_9ROSI|nr:hypothetical protein K2173_020377 [Erythroxylum novogranatense]